MLAQNTILDFFGLTYFCRMTMMLNSSSKKNTSYAIWHVGQAFYRYDQLKYISQIKFMK